MYVTVIEWDGKTPPTRYYNRMHKLGLYVRGDDDEKNPLVRRTPVHLRDQGLENIVFQEGCVVCSSEALAQTVARYARAEGAVSVQVFAVHRTEGYLNPADARIFAQLEGKLGRRGRPVGEKTNHTVTCLEEAMTYFVEQEEVHAVNCPSCKSPHIYDRQGEVNNWKFPDGELFGAWKKHRFATGRFEIANTDSGDQAPPTPQIIDNEKEVIDRMNKSETLRAQIDAVEFRIGREVATRMLDGVFCALAYNDKERRRDARLVCVMSLYDAGVGPDDVGLIEGDEPDIIEASIIGPERVAGVYKTAVFDHKSHK